MANEVNTTTVPADFVRNAKKVLWISRHNPTQDQLNGLRKITGGDGYLLNKIDKTFTSAKEIADEIISYKADYVAAVLPVNLLSGLFEIVGNQCIILVPKSKRELIKVEGSESKVNFVYDGFEVIDKIVYKSHIVK